MIPSEDQNTLLGIVTWSVLGKENQPAKKVNFTMHFGVKQRSISKRKESMRQLSQLRHILLCRLMHDSGPLVKCQLMQSKGWGFPLFFSPPIRFYRIVCNILANKSEPVNHVQKYALPIIFIYIIRIFSFCDNENNLCLSNNPCLLYFQW